MTSRADDSALADIRDLLAYRLQKAAYYATRPAYRDYARDFGVTGVEWRLLGNLYADGPLSLARVAEEADVQLAQASRTLSGLVGRGLVRRATDAVDARSVQLSLTPAGRALYRRLFRRAAELHDALVAGLSPAERASLFRALDHVAEAGRALLAEVSATDSGARHNPSAPGTRAPRAAPGRR
jgi:DNA-binding MarR family transcriptional regulator